MHSEKELKTIYGQILVCSFFPTWQISNLSGGSQLYEMLRYYRYQNSHYSTESRVLIENGIFSVFFDS